jgi:hypothetical protein
VSVAEGAAAKLLLLLSRRLHTQPLPARRTQDAQPACSAHALHTQ